MTGIITIGFFILDNLGTYKVCGQYSVGDCPVILHNFLGYLFIFIAVFMISLVTYKMRDEIFHSWLKVVYIFVPLTIILTILAPEYSESLLPITKGVVSFLFSVLFLLISIVIIFVKYFSLKKS